MAKRTTKKVTGHVVTQKIQTAEHWRRIKMRKIATLKGSEARKS